MTLARWHASAPIVQEDAMSEVASVRAREILDSRGNPTLEVEVTTTAGHRARAAVPSGASTGTREAVELRDGDPERFGGKGVLGAIAAVEGELAEVLVGRDPDNQPSNDRAMIRADGTDNKSRLGANAILGCSLALARVSASQAGVPLYRHLGADQATLLPVPFFNILNGGMHADNTVDMQEFMIAPIGLDNFAEALRAGAEIHHALKAELRERGLATGVGDEGGFAPDLARNQDAIELIMKAIARAGYRAGEQVSLALDPAASELHHDGQYVLAGEGRSLSPDEMVAYWAELADTYPIIVLEDGMAESDWAGWATLTHRLGDRLELVGDDIFVTNPEIVAQGVAQGVANSVLIKPNQIGTLTETFETIGLARRAGYQVFVSHRSGETTDDFIADLAVATRAGRIKTGAPVRGERLAKYNRLLDIERELGADAVFAGHEFSR
jgi:enolase